MITEYPTQSATLQDNIQKATGKAHFEDERRGRFLADKNIPDELLKAGELTLVLPDRSLKIHRLEQHDLRPLDYFFEVK